jgi:hypothetical protein
MKHYLGSISTFLLITLLVIAAGYFVYKGAITINWDKIGLSSFLSTTTTTKPVSTTTSTTVATEEYCSKTGSNIKMSYDEAKAIALSSDCVTEGGLKETHFCNENSGTWWIDLNIQRQGCNPACVINVETKTAEINWRCTGAIPPQ